LYFLTFYSKNFFKVSNFTVELLCLSYDSEMDSEIELLEVIRRQNVDGGVNFSGFLPSRPLWLKIITVKTNICWLN